MSVYKYVKAPPGYKLEFKKGFSYNVRVFLSLTLITLGIATFTTVAYPLLNYQYSFAPTFQQPPLTAQVTPVFNPANVMGATTTSSPLPTQHSPTFVDEVVNTSFDYTDSTNWFMGSKPTKEEQDYAVYSLSITKLGITNAIVRSDHTDLKQSLIHYPGTAFPGNLGNAVVFGHSVLPQFFNPSNYLTIFSTLHTLKPGDTIDVVADGASYTFKIAEMYETTSDDLSPLAQVYNGRYLTLITCTPPGTYLRRLIIKAYLP